MKGKVNNLVRLHETVQEKLKAVSYSEQFQILTSVLNKWSQMSVKNTLMSSNTLLKSHEIKNPGGILVKPAPPKKSKIITTETFHLVTNAYENDNFSR